MSTIYISEVVCGFPVFVSKKLEYVKKYNPDTGEPFDEKVELGNTASIEGRIIYDDLIPYDVFNGEASIEGLTFGSNNSGCTRKVWLGQVIDRRDTCGNMGIVTFPAEIPEDVLSFAKKYLVKPVWFLSMGSS